MREKKFDFVIYPLDFSWITSRFVSMRNMPEDVSNEDCSRHLPVVLLTPISTLHLTSSENRQKKPLM